MKKIILLALLLISNYVYASLELKQTFGDWQYYQTVNAITHENVILGVSDVVSDGAVNTVVLRCTTEGVNLLFLKSLLQYEEGYSAQASIDSAENFDMDVWVKGASHWATLPENQIDAVKSGKRLQVTLQGDGAISGKQLEHLQVSLDGFSAMYDLLRPSCTLD